MMRWSVVVALSAGSLVSIAAVHAAPDGVIDAGEGWTHMLEGVHGAPFSGGSLTNSDFVGESSSFNWWDSGAMANRMFNDNRADIIDVWVRSDADALHLGLAGPNVVFNNWFAGGGAGQDNDQGDIFLAIDAAGGAPAGSLVSAAGHSSFGGVKAVDFDGWTPTHIVGIRYADNGGGGGGYANLFSVASSSEVDGDPQFVDDGGFAWAWTVSGNGDGVFEITIPWTLLGHASEPAGLPLRFNAYTTQNFPASDAYDSGPAYGNGSVTEQIGDNPGDTDAGGLLGATDAGSFGEAGANFVGDSPVSAPSHNDQIDTLEEYYAWTVPGCPGDADGDLDVDFDDLNLVLANWNTAGPAGDVDQNGSVDFDDLNLVLQYWNTNCS
ncbi:MAG: hypothetical protein KDA21_08360 [Phycisphaerales bacterium]|nr:hypothetical protein [Phycisphaerales bacterium]